MFGYVCPFKPELKFKEFDEYKSYYCTLCKTLHKQNGFLAKFFLNYDFTFLALFLASLNSDEKTVKMGKCMVNPLKKCMYRQTDEETFKNVADISVIFLHYKLKDNIKDENIFKKIISGILLFLTKSSFKKAKEKLSEVNNFTNEQMAKQQQTECMKNIDIHKAAEPSATLLGKVFWYFYKNDEIMSRVLYEFGYNLGKWIYIIDAFDDFEKDVKSKSFNPFILEGYTKKDEALTKYANQLLEECITGYENAYLLIDVKQNNNLIENILFEGNPSTFCRLLKKAGKKHERSV